MPVASAAILGAHDAGGKCWICLNPDDLRAAGWRASTPPLSMHPNHTHLALCRVNHSSMHSRDESVSFL